MSDPAVRPDAADRRTWILSALRDTGFLSINDLVRELEVSHMTVRRDLHALEQAGQVRMVHGGAGLTPHALRPAAFPDDGNEAGRARVAARAAEMVGPSDTIALDAGPTAFAVALALPDDFSGAVITHSMPVLQLLDGRPTGVRTVALGGELLTGRHAFVGPATEAVLDQLRARTFFLSPVAVDSLGVYAGTTAEARVQRRLIEIADRVVLVVTHEVYTASAPARIAALDRVTALVTDRPPPRITASALRRAGATEHSSPAQVSSADSSNHCR